VPKGGKINHLLLHAHCNLQSATATAMRKILYTVLIAVVWWS